MRPLLACLLGGVIALSPGVLFAAPEAEPTPEEQAAALYYEGTTLYAASDYDGAIAKFTQALLVSSETDMSAEIRGALLQNLALAHAKAYGIKRDITHLRTAIDLYDRFLAEADDAGYPDADVEDVEARRGALVELLAQAEAEAERDPDPDDGPEPGPEVDGEDAGDEQADGDPEDEDSTGTPLGRDEPTRRDKPSKGALGLMATGAVAVAGGAVAIGIGPLFRARAQDQVDAVDDPPEREADFVDAEARKGTAWIISGSVVAAAGVGMLIAGIVMHERGRSTARTARVFPVAGPDLVGVGVGGRF